MLSILAEQQEMSESKSLDKAYRLDPELLVKSFIEDFFVWNNESLEAQRRIDSFYRTELWKMGVSHPPQIEQLKQIKDIYQLAKVQRQFASNNVKLIRQITDKFELIVKKYSPPFFSSQSPYYGSPSPHDPDNEKIRSVKTINGKSVIKTRLTKNNLGFYEGYEYQLIFQNKRWYLEQIFHVIERRKYPVFF